MDFSNKTMRIILTGGTGFVGSHVARQLIQDGHEVCVLYHSNSNLTRITDIQDQCMFFNLDKYDVSDVFKRFGADVIVHCATQYARERSNSQIKNGIETNLSFPVGLMLLAREHNCKAFINTCTFFTKLSVQSLSAYMGSYILTKKQFREWGTYLASDGKLGFITMQLEHPYGLDDNSNKFVTRFLRAIMEKADYYPLSKGTQIRDFIAVEDVAKAYSIVLSQIEQENLTGTECFEVGTGIPRTLKSFVELIKESKHSEIQLEWGAYTPQQIEIERSVATPEKLFRYGWKPSITSDADIISYFSRSQ